MKNKWIWITLSVIVVLLVVAGVGFGAYRTGVMHGRLAEASGDTSTLPRGQTLQEGDNVDQDWRANMPMYRSFLNGSMMFRPNGMAGYPFMLPLGLLLGLGALLLVVWLVVKVIKAAWKGGDSKPNGNEKPTQEQVIVEPAETAKHNETQQS
ncbi:MAG: hypothetical protein WA110_07615 [Anaerolineaceae bacterium]